MTPTDLIRKGLAAVALASLSACGAVDSDPHRFENFARRVADIRLSAEASQDAPVANPVETRTAARQGMRIEVLGLDEFWEARDSELLDNGLRGLIDAAAPVAAEAVAQRVHHAVAEGLRPALSAEPAVEPRPSVQVAATVRGAVIQLGAYSSEASAREAWTRFGQGAASAALAGLTPVFEPVEAGGRRLVRLKVGPVPADSAADICRAARVDDPWCRAAGRA